MEKGPKIQKIMEFEKLDKILECPVCLDIPFPPIHTCTEGHIACRSCHPRLTTCPLCRGSFGKARNYPLEEIINASSFSCKFKKLGCTDVILGSDFASHLRTCKANPFYVLCNDKRGVQCTNAKIRSNIYLDHLEEQHESLKTSWHHNQSTYGFYQVDEAGLLGHSINTDYFEQDGESFIEKWEFKNNLYFTWISMLNVSNDDALLENYTAEVCVYSKFDPDIKFSGKLKLHDACADLEGVQKTGSFLAFLPCQLKSSEGMKGQTWDYSWKITVRLLQKSVENEET